MLCPLAHDLRMLSRIAGSLFLIGLLTVTLVVSRSASLRGIVLTEDARIAEGSVLPSGAPVAIGDRIIRAGGMEIVRADDIDAVLLKSGGSVDLRVVTLLDEVQRQVSSSDLQGSVPEVLTPAYYITAIDGVPHFGALLPEVARALSQRGVESVEVRAVPVKSVFDGTVSVERGLPPEMVLMGGLITLLGLGLLWLFSPSLGFVVGLAGSALALWSVETILWAKVVALALLAIAGILSVWFLIEPLSQLLSRRGRARSHEGANRRPDLLDALTTAEQEFGFPVYVVVGSSSLAIEINRDYERLAVRDVDSITTSSLQMLYTEGGVFPRADVGDGVPEIWDDPIHDMDQSTGLSCAVPIPRYGTSSDQWAFVVTRVRDTPRSMELLEPVIELADLWARNGIREAIAVHASHSLFRMIREARHHSNVIPHQVSDRPAVRTSTRPKDPVDSAQTDDAPPPPRASALERPLPSLDLVSEGVGVPRTVSRAELERIRKERAVGGASTASKTESRHAPRRADEPGSEALMEEIAQLRAWAGHLERGVQDAYPVDDPSAFGEEDWYDLVNLRGDERPSLLVGESGVGKEFAARALHWNGQRAHRRIATVDCARLPVSAVELELFGGAGEGALVDLLKGGALILKSPSVLGRGLMESVFQRLASHDIQLFVVERYSGHEEGMPRVIPPSIRELVGRRFAHLRPLRERPEDIVRFANYFLHQEAMVYGESVQAIDPAAERLLETMDLPSNFVELRTLIRSAMFRADDDVVDVRALLGGSVGDVPRELARLESDEERQRLVSVLQETEGNKSEAARILGLSRGALLRRLKRHGLM